MTTAIAIFLSVIISLGITILIMVLLSTIMNCSNYGKYKSSYNLLTSGEYQFNWSGSNMYFFSRKDIVGKFSSIDNESNLSLVFSFHDNGKFSAIRLPSNNGNYSFIHGGLITWDPYTIKYRRKFLEWFEANRATFIDREEPRFTLTDEQITEMLKNQSN